MGRKTEFRAVDFVRKIRDKHAATLEGKSPQEIIAFFAAAAKETTRVKKRSGSTRRTAARP